LTQQRKRSPPPLLVGNTSYLANSTLLHLTSHDNHTHQTEETPLGAMPRPFIKSEPLSSGATGFNHSVLDPRLASNIKKEPSSSTSASAAVSGPSHPTINHNAAIATVGKAPMAKAEPSPSSLAIDPVPTREPYPNVDHDTVAAITPQASVVRRSLCLPPPMLLPRPSMGAPIVKRNLHLLSVVCPALQLSQVPPRMFQNQTDGRHFIPTRGNSPIHSTTLVSLSQNHLQRQFPLPISPRLSTPHVLERLPHSHRNLDRACDNRLYRNWCRSSLADISIHRPPRPPNVISPETTGSTSTGTTSCQAGMAVR